MKKLLYLFSAVALTLTSCSSDDDSNDSSIILVTKTIETFDDGSTITTNFLYNDNQLVEWNDSDERETFTYDATGKIVSGKYYFDGDSFNIDYTYDSQNRLIEIRNNDTEEIFEYVYNTNGTITEIRKDFDLNIDESATYSITNGNIMSIMYTISPSPITSANYSYDNLNNPFANIHLPYQLFLNYFDENKNNELNGVINNSVSNNNSFTCTYTYNSNGYPNVKTKTYGNGNIETIQYFYNN